MNKMCKHSEQTLLAMCQFHTKSSCSICYTYRLHQSAELYVIAVLRHNLHSVYWSEHLLHPVLKHSEHDQS